MLEIRGDQINQPGTPAIILFMGVILYLCKSIICVSDDYMHVYMCVCICKCLNVCHCLNGSEKPTLAYYDTELWP